MRTWCPVCRKNKSGMKGREALCCSCATALQEPPPKKRVGQQTCSGCGGVTDVQIEPGRFHCRKCNSVVEPLEFAFMDTRPEVNAEKRERQEQEGVRDRRGNRRRDRD